MYYYSNKYTDFFGGDILNKLLTTLKSLIIPKNIEYSVDEYEKCPECDGSGWDLLFWECEICNGKGVIKKPKSLSCDKDIAYSDQTVR